MTIGRLQQIVLSQFGTVNTMVSRAFTRALKAPLTRQLISPTTQRRTFSLALTGIRSKIAIPRTLAAGSIFQQQRGLKTIDFAGHKETVFGMPHVNTTKGY